jgi:hypothetical protein
MKLNLWILLLLSLTEQSNAQKVFQDYAYEPDSVQIGKGPKDFLTYSEKGFTLILPEGRQEFLGTVIALEDYRLYGGDTLKYQSFSTEATKKGLAFLIIATGVPVDLYFSEKSLMYSDTLMKSIFTRFHLPDKNIFLLGDMTCGHRALKYIEYCKTKKSEFNPTIKGVVLVESAIDWVRQWYEGQKQVRDHLTEGGFFEGNMITYLFNQNMNATPQTDISKYIEFSPYSYFDIEMKKPKLYKDLSIRAYTYADIRYWFSAQGKGVYDSNYSDMSGFINEQKLVGNKKAELIVFHSNPDDKLNNQLKSQSATWDLVNKLELVDWMVNQTH